MVAGTQPLHGDHREDHGPHHLSQSTALANEASSFGVSKVDKRDRASEPIWTELGYQSKVHPASHPSPALCYGEQPKSPLCAHWRRGTPWPLLGLSG
jgi:hypothetical protein